MLEKLEIAKEETELTIQGLHNTARELEKLRNTNPTGWEIIEQGLRNLNKEIEFNEDILDEIQGSILFEQMR
jgi:beta-glucosidase/6-phospho-beta-glucosidase/beta-galactosidase